jgi:hypothetical protein
VIARLGELDRRLYYLLHRARFERELREEMEAHRSIGLVVGPRFGNPLRLREQASDEWGWAWLDRLTQDARFGARLLRRSPVFSLTAVLVLARGIGVNLAGFEVFDAVALSWLPVRSPQTLVSLSIRTKDSRSTAFSYPEYRVYSTRARSMADTYALVYGAVDLDGAAGTGAEFVNVAYFADLGVRPVAGRSLDPADERSGAAPVIVLEERACRRPDRGGQCAVDRVRAARA